MRTVLLNGSFVSQDAARISVFDRGLLFADAVYEVIAVLGGKMVDFDLHMARLRRSTTALSMGMGSGAMGPGSMGSGGMETADDSDADNASRCWHNWCEELIARNALQEGLIYLQITRGVADRDFCMPSGLAQTSFAFTQEKAIIDNPKAATGLHVVTRPDLRWARPDIKTTQLLYASMMKSEAQSVGADDVWLERDGMITEGTSQNAAIITEQGQFLTRPADQSILSGVTRISILDIARRQGLEVIERPFSIKDAQQAQEAMVTASSTFVLPVISLNGCKIGTGLPGEHVARLRRAYIDAHLQESLGCQIDCG